MPEFDYSKKGAYFITICTQHRRHILSTIVVGEGAPLPRFAVARLSRFGEIAKYWIEGIPEKYPAVSVDRYVIMPNHIHLLLEIHNNDGRGDPSPTIDGVVGWFKYQVTRDINLARSAENERVFQRSFYDHVIRNREDYEEIVRYIHENPMRWEFDRFYKEE